MQSQVYSFNLFHYINYKLKSGVELYKRQICMWQANIIWLCPHMHQKQYLLKTKYSDVIVCSFEHGSFVVIKIVLLSLYCILTRHYITLIKLLLTEEKTIDWQSVLQTSQESAPHTAFWDCFSHRCCFSSTFTLYWFIMSHKVNWVKHQDGMAIYCATALCT